MKRWRRSKSNPIYFKDGTMGDKKVHMDEVTDIEQCYTEKFDLDNLKQMKGAINAVTRPSNFFDKKAYKEAKKRGDKPKRAEFSKASEFACTMDISKWYLAKADKEKFPKIDAERMALAKTDDFKATCQQ